MLNETHDPSATSWVASANEPDADFPIQNLPFASFRRRAGGEPFRIGVAIGDQVVDLAAVAASARFEGAVQTALQACRQPHLNELMAQGPASWTQLRRALFGALKSDAPARRWLEECLLSQAEVECQVPCRIGDYTDFYCSIHHAKAVGALFRPDNPLLPNYKWLPIAYHGRSSSIGVSGQQFHRPWGQLHGPEDAAPRLRPCRRLDYELEVGIFIGPGNPLGQPIPIAQAEQQLFGLCLLNDWSARDVQAWEYQPLGPFLAKSFATTLSPWVVTAEALAPYRVEWQRDPEDPQPLSYLDSQDNRRRGAIDLHLEVLLETDNIRGHGGEAQILSQTNFRHCYWTVAQMITHHSVSGCNLQPGDLLGSGTQSGPRPQEAGSLLELSRGGKQPLQLGNGEQRTFLEDGDAVILRGWCERPGAVRIGFGECRGQVLAAHEEPSDDSI